ncbi:MAG: hypothetical protein FIB04_04275 [Gammaproteobacteria bacterium]|nr:hypothetical protein [Gammaproteobacteria bacterium]
MNDVNLLPPCAEFEFDLVDLRDGALGPDRARAVRAHVHACARCRGWLESFAALDAHLAEHLPRPALSSDFAARLEARLSAATRRAPASELLAAEDDEYSRLLAALRRNARRNAVLGGIAVAAVAAGGILLTPALLTATGSLLGSLPAQERAIGLGSAGAMIAIAALAWSALQGALPMIRGRA